MIRPLQLFLVVTYFTLLSCSPSGSKSLEDMVDEFTLDNGLKVLLVKREGAPVFSAYLRVNVGNIEEPQGSSGLAHFFEHMAFKGTPTIGTRDYESEKKLLLEIHTLGTQIVQQRKKGVDPKTLEPIVKRMEEVEAEHQKLLIKNEFVRIYQRNGGTDINATTSNDYTSYFVSLPSSKLGLWAHMESDRLLNPVLREFYKEKDVVAEERRMRYDTNPDGRLYEAYLFKAFNKSPYRINVIGIPEEIQGYTYKAAKDFYKKYYIPSRMVLAVVGNFNKSQAKKLIKKFFGRLPSKEDLKKEFPTEEFNKSYPREHKLFGKDEARFYIGFHRPAYPNPNDEVFDVIEGLLCDGRTSRLYSVLVNQKKMASRVSCYSSLPGSRLDGLFTFYATPLKGYTNQGIAKEILKQLTIIKEQPVSQKELDKIKNRIDANLIWGLKSNMGLARMLTYFESLTGSWKYLLDIRGKIDKITPADIQRVSKKYFVPGRQVMVSLEKE